MLHCGVISSDSPRQDTLRTQTREEPPRSESEPHQGSTSGARDSSLYAMFGSLPIRLPPRTACSIAVQIPSLASIGPVLRCDGDSGLIVSLHPSDSVGSSTSQVRYYPQSLGAC